MRTREEDSSGGVVVAVGWEAGLRDGGIWVPEAGLNFNAVRLPWRSLLGNILEYAAIGAARCHLYRMVVDLLDITREDAKRSMILSLD